MPWKWYQAIMSGYEVHVDYDADRLLQEINDRNLRRWERERSEDLLSTLFLSQSDFDAKYKRGDYVETSKEYFDIALVECQKKREKAKEAKDATKRAAAAKKKKLEGERIKFGSGITCLDQKHLDRMHQYDRMEIRNAISAAQKRSKRDAVRRVVLAVSEARVEEAQRRMAATADEETASDSNEDEAQEPKMNDSGAADVKRDFGFKERRDHVRMADVTPGEEGERWNDEAQCGDMEVSPYVKRVVDDPLGFNRIIGDLIPVIAVPLRNLVRIVLEKWTHRENAKHAEAHSGCTVTWVDVGKQILQTPEERRPNKERRCLSVSIQHFSDKSYDFTILLCILERLLKSDDMRSELCSPSQDPKRIEVKLSDLLACRNWCFHQNEISVRDYEQCMQAMEVLVTSIPVKHFSSQEQRDKLQVRLQAGNSKSAKGQGQSQVSEFLREFNKEGFTVGQFYYYVKKQAQTVAVKMLKKVEKKGMKGFHRVKSEFTGNKRCLDIDSVCSTI